MSLTVAPPYPYHGPEELENLILGALRKVVDPEVALNIVDVGLVYGVFVSAERLHAQITMTSVACPVTDVILEDVCTALESVVPESLAIDVELVWEPPWSPGRMSDKAKAFMGW